MLQRSALGRIGCIGELYDARSDSLASIKLFKSTLPPAFISTTDTSKTNFEYRETSSLSDKLSLLDVNGELQLSIAAGLVSVGGAGKYICREHSSKKTVTCSLLCNISTVTEKLTVTLDELAPHLHLDALDNNDFTHVIVQVDWGANCVLSLEKTCELESERSLVEGELNGRMESLLKYLENPKGRAEMKKENSIQEGSNGVVIKVTADVIAEDVLPTTVEGFCQLVKDLPKLMAKVGEGKGKPLKYEMMPLSNLRKTANGDTGMVRDLYKAVDESFMISIMYFLDEIEDLKLRFKDLVNIINKNLKYVERERANDAKKQKIELEQKVADAKIIISEGLLHLRSGKATSRNVIERIENFKRKSLLLHEYEVFLDSCADIEKKLAFVKFYVSHGVKYLGEGETLSDVIASNPSQFFTVLKISFEMRSSHTELFEKTISYFTVLATNKKSDTIYVVHDMDFQPKDGKKLKGGPTILYMKGSDTISHDLYADYLAEKQRNVVRLTEGCSSEVMVNKPGKRSILQMICPGFQLGSCTSDTLKWSCYRCKALIEYGFNNCFYCNCGEGKSELYEFRCSNNKHGSSFVKPDSNFLNKQLKNVPLSKEINILVLGQTGVGKSTWINSIVNYMHYDSMESAEKGGVICTIPVKFDVYDLHTFEKTEVEVGKNREEEVLRTGESATQLSKAYTFFWEDNLIRIIDTPGIGDTGGIKKDKENMQNIVDLLGYLNNIHAVCILFKANVSRLTPVFSYCLKELLGHLHKSAARNIMFCFTNSRNSSYGPGQSASVIRKLLENLNIQNEVTLGPKNCFCLDNEAFLFLCTRSYSTIRYPDRLVTSLEHSWEISVEQTRRFFEEVKNLKPHLLVDTLSLVKARNKIIWLSRPIAQITYIIQLNIEELKSREVELKKSKKTLDELEKKKIMKVTILKPIDLDHPRTVCTSPNCVKYLTYKHNNVREIEYSTHCHKHCYLDNVVPKVVNNVALQECLAMENGICKVCGCGWQNHMHITYDQERVEVEHMDKEIMDLLNKQMTEKQKKEILLRELEIKAEKYKEELKTILKISSEMGEFLKTNAISIYNDAIKEYITFLIKEEENKPYKTEGEFQLIEELKKTLKDYEAEVQILEDAIRNSCNSQNMTVERMSLLEEELYKLPLTGEQIKNMVKTSRNSNQRHAGYSETPLYFKSDKKKKETEEKTENLKKIIPVTPDPAPDFSSRFRRLIKYVKEF